MLNYSCSRGLGDDSKIKAFMPQAFALLVLSIRRSTTLATAMEARGFGGENPRSHARISHVNKRDYVFMIGCLIIPALADLAMIVRLRLLCLKLLLFWCCLFEDLQLWLRLWKLVDLAEKTQDLMHV